jgi:hypothetical protein
MGLEPAFCTTEAQYVALMFRLHLQKVRPPFAAMLVIRAFQTFR